MSDNKMTAEQALDNLTKASGFISFAKDELEALYKIRFEFVTVLNGLRKGTPVDVLMHWLVSRGHDVSMTDGAALTAPRVPDIAYPDAVKASIKMLRSKFHGARCDSDGVSGCVHCNVMFLCAQVEKLLAASPEPVADSNSLRSAIEQAHMAGQADAGVDPSYSNASNYAEKVAQKNVPRSDINDIENLKDALSAKDFVIGNLKAQSDGQEKEIDDLRAEVEALRSAAAGMVRIVEEFDGAVRHGTWCDSNGMRLKDTPEWVALYLAARHREGDPS